MIVMSKIRAALDGILADHGYPNSNSQQQHQPCENKFWSWKLPIVLAKLERLSITIITLGNQTSLLFCQLGNFQMLLPAIYTQISPNYEEPENVKKKKISVHYAQRISIPWTVHLLTKCWY